MKVFNMKRHGAAESFETEKKAYKDLRKLQGKSIPELLCTGRLPHTYSAVIVTALHGTGVPENRKVPKRLHKAMRATLQAFHKAGAAHGDIRPCNFLVSGSEMRLIDLGMTKLRATQAQRKADLEKLEEFLV